MKKKFLYIMLFLFVGGPVLQSCGSSRGCKKMRKYRTNASCEPTKKLTYPRTKY